MTRARPSPRILKCSMSFKQVDNMTETSAQRKANMNYRKKSVTQLNVALFPADQDIIDHLSGMPNKAQYIRDLIRRDMYVTNDYGVQIDFDAAVNLMDDDLREELHAELAPCDKQEFFDAYAKAHQERFGEEWIPNTPTPQM